ncbi:MAG: hypothetical protein KC619_28265 [Myxococcales bacterium]|nr:hypothetical protein [Myxococcales bacterium]
MDDPVADVKHHARILHDAATRGDEAALGRLRRLPELDALDDPSMRAAVRRRHCLAAVAKELGFRSWPHAKAVLEGIETEDLGELMHRTSGGAYWNIWSASYDEATSIRRDHGGWLLAYRRQFLIVDEHFIEHLGLDPEDEDWARIGRDWVRPADRAAWTRLASRAVRARLA